MTFKPSRQFPIFKIGNLSFILLFAPPSLGVVWGKAGGYLYMSPNLELYLAYCQIGEV